MVQWVLTILPGNLTHSPVLFSPVYFHFPPTIHTYQSVHPYYRNRIGDYAVPMVYYHPGNPDLKGPAIRLTQHIDVVNYLNQVYQYLEDDRVLFHDGEQATALFNLRSDSLLRINYLPAPGNEYIEAPGEHLEKRLKSIIQQFNSRMVNNRLTAG